MVENNDKEMYSIYNERQSVVAEIFIKTLKKNIEKHMSAVSKTAVWCFKWYCW